MDAKKGIIDALKLVGIAIGAVVLLFVSIFVGVILVGTLFSVSSDLDLSNATNNTLTSAETAFHSMVGQGITAGQFAMSLLLVVIVLLVFASFGLAGYGIYRSVKKARRDNF
jgi:hypothetical protein